MIEVLHTHVKSLYIFRVQIYKELMEAFLRYKNKRNNTQGKLIPNTFIKLSDGTVVKRGDSTEFCFLKYYGDESNRLSFEGITENGCLMFLGEGPIGVELKERYQGCDYPDCRQVLLPWDIAAKSLVACPRGIFGGAETTIQTTLTSDLDTDCCVFRSRYCECA